MATNNVIWDPSAGRFRNRATGQFATHQQMQDAGVSPRVQPPERHAWAISANTTSTGGSQRDSQDRFVAQNSQPAPTTWLTRPRSMRWLTSSRPANVFRSSRFGTSLMNGTSWLSGAAAQGGAFLQSAAGGVSNVLGGITRPIAAVFGIFGAVGRAIGTVAQAIASVIGVLLRALAMLARMVGGVLLTVIGLVVARFVSLVGAVVLVTKAAMGLARDLALVHANTGLSFTQGKGVVDRLRPFGVSSGDVAGFLRENPLLMQTRAAMFGMPALTDSNYPVAMARRYQQMAAQGPFGREIANRALDAQFGGSAPDNIRLMANMPIKTIQAQMAYNDKVQGQLGVNPEVLRKFAEEVPLVINRIGMLWEAVKVKFAVEMLPLIENSLGFVADFLGKNIGNIAKFIGQAAQWMVKVFPFLVINGLKLINDGALWFVNAMAKGAHFVADSLRSMAAMFDAFADGDNTFLDVIGNILKGIDYLSVGLNAFAKVLGLIYTAAYNVMASLVNLPVKIANSLSQAPAALLKFLGLDGLASKVQVKAVPMVPLLDPKDIHAWNFTTDMYGSWENFRNSKGPGQAAGSLRSGADAVDTAANAASQWAQSKHDAAGNVLNSAENWMKDNLTGERIADGVERTARATEKTAQATMQTAINTLNLMSRVMSNLIEDESFNLTRVSG